MSERFNILLIHADQHRQDCLGVNGHGLVRTPHLDGLAREGINFTHAFTPSPVCVPARSSLMAGALPTQHLAIANSDTEAPRPMRDDLPVFSEILRGAGYRMGMVGKWGIHGQRSPLDMGFETYIAESEYGAWRAAQGLPPPPHDWMGATDVGVTPEQSRLGWGAERVIEMLQDFAGGDAPFFARWDPSEPHLPNVPPEPYAALYKPGEIAPWASFPDPLTDKPYIQRQMRRSWGIDGWNWQDWQPVVARYLGVISLLDAQVGRILHALDALGLAHKTLVIYTCDHGDLCGGHGMIDKHCMMYDDVVRVPLMMRLPGVIAPGRTCDAFVCHALDLAASFCDIAGVQQPDSFTGSSLMPLLRGERSTHGGEDIFAMYQGNQFGLYSERMVRDRHWKYVWNATAEDELYDLRTDAGELHNLAGCAESEGERTRLRHRLADWMQSTHDPLWNDWVRGQLLGGTKP